MSGGSIYIEVPYQDDEERELLLNGEGQEYIDAVVERGIVQTVDDGEHAFQVMCAYCLMEPFDLNGNDHCSERTEDD